ncbi:protein of unknown function [Candidatus Nitrospira inopinata]|uniref:Uncharacterized protein n=1 Tax=Candidatus Nitrospira inopinata TaxID=1715989 RepID=A0A0S4KVD5_9BACT|nr:protein of unknown function [Candidatus Nitrospira inopinata]
MRESSSVPPTPTPERRKATAATLTEPLIRGYPTRLYKIRGERRGKPRLLVVSPVPF